MVENLYVHFPFCRRKCRYCALYSHVGVPASARAAYVRQLAASVGSLAEGLARWGVADGGFGKLKTVYFGGGSPALCDLRPLLAALAPHRTAETEFTVELHPLDVTDDVLGMLRDGGVNRISMGVQSLDDATLAAMGRGYTVAEAARAFARVTRVFGNAGIDLIVGYPGDPCVGWARLGDWGLRHASVYSLQNERGLADVPDDDWTLDRIRAAAAALAELGLARYEISNYAVPGAECRHNLAVWRGEDYVGLGAGACGRIGLLRTRNFGVERELEVKGGDAARVGGERWRWRGDELEVKGGDAARVGGERWRWRGDELEVKGGGGEWKLTLPRSTSDSHLHLKKEEHPRSTSDSHLHLKEKCEVETLSPERDALERRIFRLRTREGLDATGYPQWGQSLASACESGLLTRENEIYRLTSRGTEVCDAILAELV